MRHTPRYSPEYSSNSRLSPVRRFERGLWMSMVFLGVFVGLFCSASEARADSLRGELPPWELSEDERRKNRWSLHDQGGLPGSPLCGLGAMTLGAVWNGFGHYCLEDTDSMESMLIVEATGIALIAAGAGVFFLTKDSDNIYPIANTLSYTGVMLLASNYFLDVLGAFKGNTRDLFENQREREGFSPQFITRWVPDDPGELSVVLGLELPLIYRRFRINPKGYFDIDFKFWQLGGDLAFKLWQGRMKGNHVAFGGEGRYESFEAAGFNVLVGLPYFEWSFDAGSFFSHLEGFFIISRLGYGFEFYDWELIEARDGETFRDVTSLFVLETEWSLNLSENTNMGFYYRQRPDLLLGGLARELGMIGLRLQFASEPWQIKFESNFGTIAEFWLSIGFFTDLTKEG